MRRCSGILFGDMRLNLPPGFTPELLFAMAGQESGGVKYQNSATLGGALQIRFESGAI